MSKKTQKQTVTAFDAFIADIDTAQRRSNTEEKGVADVAVHLAKALIDADKGGNYPQFKATIETKAATKKDKAQSVDVHVTLDTAMQYAQGKLSKGDITHITETLALQSPEVGKARAKLRELNALPKDQKVHFAASIEQAKTKATAATQMLQRPLRAVAYLHASPEFDLATIEASTNKHGQRVIKCQRTMEAAGETVSTVVEVSQAMVNKGLTKIAADNGKAPTKRNREASKQNGKADGVSVVEAVKAAGDKPVSVTRNRYAQLLATLVQTMQNAEPDTLTPAERDAELQIAMAILDRHGMDMPEPARAKA